MADTPKVYVYCDANCKWEGMTKEQILTAIAQAVSTGEITDIDTGFVQTIKTINGKALKFFVGSQSEYDGLSEEAKENLFAIITNDMTKDELLNTFNEMARSFEELEEQYRKFSTGENPVPYADRASKIDASATFVGHTHHNADLPVVFVEGAGTNKVAHSTNGFTYNPSTKTLTVGNIKGDYTGNATTATRATEANHADNATTADEATSVKCLFNKGADVYDGDALFECEIPNGLYACDFTSRTGIRSCGVVTIMDNNYSRNDKYSSIGDGVVIHWFWHTFVAEITGTGKDETWLKAQILVDGERDIEANGYIHLYQIAKF